ncbi:MAG: hypothetical protein AAF636_23135 [Pseudomonadota bacterium]
MLGIFTAQRLTDALIKRVHILAPMGERQTRYAFVIRHAVHRVLFNQRFHRV